MPTVSPPWTYTLELPHDPRAPGVARTTLRAVLAVHGLAELTATAELLAVELLTNAYRHTQGPCALRLRSAERDRLRVAVWDSDPTIPPGFGGPPGALGGVPPEDAECGRGLHLVRACADAWGAYVLGDAANACGGKLLWAECGREAARAGGATQDVSGVTYRNGVCSDREKGGRLWSRSNGA
ncbi:ATP-binding protein [Streptomyces sp. PSKA54]|uniref:ATP-binding protein n=1 Tax=Streptomyces himalayensis subsp. aureolus TaxID=2758039 RepID=A0A7W2D694_9ACTN|nr:ATP-binding protein [Streptomyces himalayensis]MBA4865551.1 ATP-binding protein [Streptomyces himalayensis subsp. aureolus]